MVLIDLASMRVAYLIQEGVQGISTSTGSLLSNFAQSW
jgi:hypothetical protein